MSQSCAMCKMGISDVLMKVDNDLYICSVHCLKRYTRELIAYVDKLIDRAAMLKDFQERLKVKQNGNIFKEGNEGQTQEGKIPEARSERDVLGDE